ncbi:unnamed protein product [Thlaspi arvense]|uniref:Protein kinase domain-containing protein n=1 Tax=Thlaspi arvense TaxID=13288 RepID=A0AAU9RGF1_THLAR|nr:unnamed protein product [Thlaspi arvense]
MHRASSADSPQGFCRQFSLAEIQAATNNFDDTLLIGKGGFGKVYKGFIDGGATIVAIKRLNAESKQGAQEFWTEVKALSKLRHPNLVSLVGYADEFQEMILVYDYLANGNLADHLYKFSRKGIEADNLTLFGEIASKCIHSHPRGRPTMAKVMGSLELVLAREQNSPQCEGMITKLLPKIRAITNNFHKQRMLYHNSFCDLYKGFINGENLEVAIKRWRGEASNRKLELLKEQVQLQAHLCHLHLHSLIGYCCNKDKQILVYELMHRGSLYQCLYTRKNDSLPWKKRLEIGIGIARGLHYLHSGTKQTIIHQNLNASTILLDKNWVAKVAGLEFSTIYPANISSTSPNDIVPSKVEYLDPKCLKSEMLTVKSNVYSFGVILLELLCGRKLMIMSQNEDKVNLVCLFKTNLEMGTIDEILDPCLANKIAPECLREYMKIAANCVKDKGIERPTIEDVLGRLMGALQLQQNWEYSKKLHDEIDKNREDVGGMSVVNLDDSDYFFSNLVR